MLKRKESSFDVGVIIARFQVDQLHDGHRELIESVAAQSSRVLIFLGLSPLKATRNNPLDKRAREQMLIEAFPHLDLDVNYIHDVPSDQIWSKELDKQISGLVGPEDTVGIYGSRDAFISHYNGRHETVELVQKTFISGTEVRKNIGKTVKPSSEFRAGVIWATRQQYVNPKCTVDIALLNDDRSKVLLGKRYFEKQRRFVGGFIDPNERAEVAAAREVLEETKLEIGGAAALEYVGSYVIDDWRYRGEAENILTFFYIGQVKFGRPEPNEELTELVWIDLVKFPYENEKNWKKRIVNNVVPEHRCLMEALFEKVVKTNPALIVNIEDVEED